MLRVKRTTFFLLVVASLFLIVAWSRQADGQTRKAAVTVFEGARLITGDGSAPIENSAFLVENNLFTRVGRRGALQVPAGAVHVDLTGKTVMPAMIDLHGHFGFQHVAEGTMAKEFFTRENLIDHLERLAYYGVSAIVGIGDLVDRSDCTAAGRIGATCRCGCATRSFPMRRCFARRARALPGPDREPKATLPEWTFRIRSPRSRRLARPLTTTSA